MQTPMNVRAALAPSRTGSTARLALALAFALVSSAACGSSSPTSPGGNGAITSITVTPNVSMTVNGTQQFTAVAKNANGGVVAMTPAWSVVAGGGTISTSGLFTAGAVAGTYANTVKAASAGISGFASVALAPAAAPPPTIVLGSTSTEGIVAGSTVTCVNLGMINAGVGIWPGSAITGFPPCAISGVQHIADASAQTQQGDLTALYNQLDAVPCGATITTDLGGQTLQPGVYCSLSSQGLTGQMFLDAIGNANAVFIIKVGSSLTTAMAQVTLLRGAQAKNVYWLIGASATFGVGSAMKGNVVALTSISLVDNATLLGRALARNGAVSLGTSNTITLP
jgi:hypothetical protein